VPSPTQKPTLVSVAAQTVITNATTISIYSVTGATTVTSQGTAVLPEGVGVTLQSDDTIIGDVTVTPAESGSAIIVYFK
jgi:predicted membrane protein